MTTAVEVNKNLRALLENQEAYGTSDYKPIVCLEGSARSGKTWSWIEFLINLLAQHRLVATVFRYDGTTHKTSTIRDFKSLIQFPDYAVLWKEGHWNNQDKTFTFKNGSILEFSATNDESKLHGPERDIAVFNEAMEHHYEAYRQIVARTRFLTIMDWNPSLSNHWLFSRVISRSDCLYLHSTYKDNPHLAKKIVQEIEATNPNVRENKINGTADPFFWAVYGKGLRAKREGAIFDKEWFFVDSDKFPQPHQCQRHGYGLDFGYSVDPAVLVECGLFQSGLYGREIFREKGLVTIRSHASPNTRSIQGLLEEFEIPKNAIIVADSARPEQIAELNNEGYSVIPCVKGAGSVVAGLDLMKTKPLHIDIKDADLHDELNQYAWRRRPDGTWMDEPEDRFNHGIDAMRYWCQEELRQMTSETLGAAIGVQARKLRRY